MSVTVTVPVYNDARFLAETLASVEAQTVEPLEVLIVDDGSKPPCPHDGWMTRPLERIIRVSHRGPQNAWNTALMLAQGEWLLPLASDDWIDPDFLEQALALSADADVVVPAMREYGARTGFWPPELRTLDQQWSSNAYPYCSLYRVETLRNIGGWHGMLHAFPDWGMWIDLLQRGARIALAPDAVFNYRVHPDSHLQSMNGDDRADEIARLHGYYGSVTP